MPLDEAVEPKVYADVLTAM